MEVLVFLMYHQNPLMLLLILCSYGVSSRDSVGLQKSFVYVFDNSEQLWYMQFSCFWPFTDLKLFAPATHHPRSTPQFSLWLGLWYHSIPNVKVNNNNIPVTCQFAFLIQSRSLQYLSQTVLLLLALLRQSQSTMSQKSWIMALKKEISLQKKEK